MVKVWLERAQSRLFPLSLCELGHLATQRKTHPQKANTSALLTCTESAIQHNVIVHYREDLGQADIVKQHTSIT